MRGFFLCVLGEKVRSFVPCSPLASHTLQALRYGLRCLPIVFTGPSPRGWGLETHLLSIPQARR